MADEELHRVPVNHESVHFKSAPATPELKEKISDFQEQKQLPVPDVSPVADHSWPEPIANTSASKATSPDEYFAVVAPSRAMQKTSDALMASGVLNFVIGLLLIVFMISVHFLVLAKHDNPILVFSGLGLFAFFSAMLRRSKMRSGIQQRAIEQKMLFRFHLIYLGLLAFIAVLALSYFSLQHINIGNGDRLLKSGQYQKAIETYQSTFALTAVEQSILAERTAKAYEKMGDDAKASQFHNKADKLYSKNWMH